jgi:hypothetical protein
VHLKKVMTIEGFGNFAATELGILIAPPNPPNCMFDEYFCAETAQKYSSNKILPYAIPSNRMGFLPIIT